VHGARFFWIVGLVKGTYGRFIGCI
jgi:hypothetical protein